MAASPNIPNIPNIPYIPRATPTASTPPPPADDTTGGFTVRDALAWLGIDKAAYLAASDVLTGRHGGPLVSAVLDARAAQGTSTTPAEVLARYGIDPADPVAAARRYDRRRAAYDDDEDSRP